jgi:hypothetical protein
MLYDFHISTLLCGMKLGYLEVSRRPIWTFLSEGFQPLVIPPLVGNVLLWVGYFNICLYILYILHFYPFLICYTEAAAFWLLVTFLRGELDSQMLRLWELDRWTTRREWSIWCGGQLLKLLRKTNFIWHHHTHKKNKIAKTKAKLIYYAHIT